jgi:hypothetical protein
MDPGYDHNLLVCILRLDVNATAFSVFAIILIAGALCIRHGVS